MRALDPEVVDAIWPAIAALLPERTDNHPLGCHRPRAADRDCFQVMLVRLVTGCSWEDAERLCGNNVSDTTVRERRDEWEAAGVFDKIAAEAIAAYDRVIGLDLSDVAVDGSLHKSPCGGEGTGPNPTDRAKLGWKWSILTDRRGVPIGWTTDGANRHDSILLAPTLDDVAARGLLDLHAGLHLYVDVPVDPPSSGSVGHGQFARPLPSRSNRHRGRQPGPLACRLRRDGRASPRRDGRSRGESPKADAHRGGGGRPAGHIADAGLRTDHAWRTTSCAARAEDPRLPTSLGVHG